ncbi:hypothetical protein ACFYYH_25225 [Streptomyces sp. NPDC002018]|uniref:hypothetical protein n=1 Tax=Streptomyces sp. NPDC002018 TaxID=3364629 RepID=UPI0036820B4E
MAACGGDDHDGAGGRAASAAEASRSASVAASASARAQAQEQAQAQDRTRAQEAQEAQEAQARTFARSRFAAHAGLAAGAAYRWIVEPYRAGLFEEGATNRTYALIKAGLAGTFAYNRLTAASESAQGDPLLAKAVAPLAAGIASLRGLGAKFGKGEAGSAEVGMVETVINDVKGAGSSAGAVVKDKVPPVSQLGRG